jgi:hypothetical protein
MQSWSGQSYDLLNARILILPVHSAGVSAKSMDLQRHDTAKLMLPSSLWTFANYLKARQFGK